MGWARATPSSKAPVVLITVDTLRADRLGCYGAKRVKTPAMDSLAADGVRFENALAQVPITLPSHAVILSGTYPMYNGVRDFTSPGVPANVGLLAEAFARQNYSTAAFVSAFVLDSSWGFGRGFQTYDDQFDPRQFETQNPGNIQRRADQTVDRLLAWLRSNASGPAAEPSFVWLHLYDPHSDYNPPEPFRTQYAGRLYDGEVAYVDSQLARLLTYMKQSGIYERTLIVLLSDHGESLGEHGEDEHGFFVYNSTLRVPMIFKLPARSSAPRVVPSPVGTVDVAPTILELLQIRDQLSQQFQGVSLVSMIQGKSVGERPVYSETYYPRDSFGWSPLRSLVTNRYHFIEAPRPEIFELATDPDEQRNLIDQRRADAESLRAQLQDVERRYAAHLGASKASPLSPETLEKLKSLGYLAYSAPSPSAGVGSQADPKDKIATLRQILWAADLNRLKRYAEADRLLGEISGSEPDLYVIPFQRGENFLAWGKPGRAVPEFKKSLAINATFEQAMLGLGRAYFLMGEDEASTRALQSALLVNPTNFRAHLALAKVYWRREMLGNAATEVEAAIRLRSGFGECHATRGIILTKLGRYREGLRELTKGLGLGYRDAVTFNYLGIANSQLGNPQGALQAYEKAVVLDSKYPAAQLNLALQYKKLGQMEKAQAHYKDLCAINAALCRQYASAFEARSD